MTSFFRKFTWWMRRRRKEAELREELQFHLEEEAGERQARGLAGEEARRAARRELGNVALVQEDTRAAWTWTLRRATRAGHPLRPAHDGRQQDLQRDGDPVARPGNRRQHRHLQLHGFDPAALAAGARSAVPGDAELAYPAAAKCTASNRHNNSFNDPNGGFVGGFFAYPAFELLRKNDSVFSSVFGYQGAGDLNLTFRGQAELARTEYVSGDYFRGLGIPPAAGRLIAPDDDRAGAPAIAVISFALSQKRFGGPENAPGQSILINNLPVHGDRRRSARVLWRRSRQASGRLCSDARQPASGGPGLLSRDVPRPELRLGCAHGALASRRQRDAGTGGAGRPVLRMGAHRATRSAGRRTFPLWLSGKARAASTACGGDIRSRCISC